MIEKIKAKFSRKKTLTGVDANYKREDVRKAVAQAYAVGYTDGKRDGLAIARQSAIKTMKEILWEQNKTK